MLTDVKIKQAKPGDKAYKLADGRGLYIEVSPNGSKYWRYKYRISVNGKLKEKRLSLGVYPAVGLKKARELHNIAHVLVSLGKRNLLAEQFYRDLFEVWELKGRGALEKLIEKDPGGFVKLVGSVMPREAASSILVGTAITELNRPTVEVSLIGVAGK